MLDHFRFLKKHADAAGVTAKMTIPSPAVLHFRGGRNLISKDVYPDLEPFFEDLGKAGRRDDDAVREAARIAVRRSVNAGVGKKPQTEVHVVRI